MTKRSCYFCTVPYGVIDRYRVLDGGVLLALDGVWYHSSRKIHCDHCLRMTKDGVTTYYHSMVAGSIVKPGDKAVVLPVMGEMIRNEDGAKKRDCERNATKRWLKAHSVEYGWLKPTLLGDDLYANYPLCRDILDSGMSFIFTCKEETHPWISETVRYSYPEVIEDSVWNGRNHLIHRYKWLNGVEIRDDKETLLVNYLYLEVENKETGKITYKNRRDNE